MTKYLKDQTSETFEILFKILSQTGSPNNYRVGFTQFTRYAFGKNGLDTQKVKGLYDSWTVLCI